MSCLKSGKIWSLCWALFLGLLNMPRSCTFLHSTKNGVTVQSLRAVSHSFSNIFSFLTCQTTQAFYAKRRTILGVQCVISAVPAGADKSTNISSLFNFFLPKYKMVLPSPATTGAFMFSLLHLILMLTSKYTHGTVDRVKNICHHKCARYLNVLSSVHLEHILLLLFIGSVSISKGFWWIVKQRKPINDRNREQENPCLNFQEHLQSLRNTQA